MPEHQDWPHFKYHPNLYELDILEHFEGICEFDYVWTTRKDDYVLVRDECGYAIVNRREQALLKAMQPYLSDKRRGKLDRALRLARLARIARLAMGETGGGDDQPL